MQSLHIFALITALALLIGCTCVLLTLPSSPKNNIILLPSNQFTPLPTLNKFAVLNRVSVNQDVSVNQKWCESQNVDHYPLFNDQEPWAAILELCLKKPYSHVMFVDSDMYFQNPALPITTILSQAGDTELILTRDDTDFTKVNLRAFILRNSPWGRNKLAECHKHGVRSSTHLTRAAQKVVFHNINTNYKHRSLWECKKQVDVGLPYAMSDVVVFNEHAFNSPYSAFLATSPVVSNPKLVHPWALVPGFVHMEKHLDKLPEVSEVANDAKNNRHIPKRIAQSMETTLTEVDRYEYSAKKWQDMNPEYQYVYFDALDCKQLIEDHFSSDVLKAYNMLLPGAFKCDLWRLCYLYLYGGVYVDCQTMPIQPLREILSPDTLFCSAIDREDFALWQGFLCAAPRHPLLLQGIYDIVYNVLHKRKLHTLEFTGPHALGFSRNKWLKRSKRCSVEHGPPVPHEKMYYHKPKTQPYICDKQGNPVLLTKYFYDKTLPCTQKKVHFISQLSGKENYASAVKHNRVYKKLY